MILKSEPLSDYVASYRDAGIDVAAFPSSRGDRYVLRLVDPDDPETGTAYLASFANALKEANRPSDPKAQTKANKALDEMLNDVHQMSKYTVCYCVIDTKSVEKYPEKYTSDDINKQFITVTRGTAKSDSHREYDEAKAEAKADAKRSTKRVSKK